MTTVSKPRIFTACGRASTSQLVWSAAFAAELIIFVYILKHWDLPLAVRYLLPILTFGVGAQYIRVMVRDIRRQKDELQLRIYLEAAAVIVCGLFLFILAYPVLEIAHIAGPLDSSVVLAIMVALGIVGYATAARRYR